RSLSGDVPSQQLPGAHRPRRIGSGVRNLERAAGFDVARHTRSEEPAGVAARARRGLWNVLLYGHPERHYIQWGVRADFREDARWLEDRGDHGIRSSCRRAAAV